MTPAALSGLDLLATAVVVVNSGLAVRYMPGCIGARKLLATVGWGKHSILYEYASLEAREERFVPHEEQAHDGQSWTARILPQLVHAPCSPAVGRRIWPE